MQPISHPGQILKTRFLDRLSISPYQLAKAIGVHVSRISKLIQGERSLTPDTAMRLGLYFGVPAQWWMDMQTRFDLDDADRLERLREVVEPLQRPAGVAIGPDGVRVFDGPARGPGRGVAVPEDLLARLEAQVALTPARVPREVESVDYPNGYRAIVGASV